MSTKLYKTTDVGLTWNDTGVWFPIDYQVLPSGDFQLMTNDKFYRYSNSGNFKYFPALKRAVKNGISTKYDYGSLDSI